jgi:hypothetical protein
MTLCDIKITYFENNFELSDSEWLKLFDRIIPEVRYIARALAEKYYEFNDITQRQIKNYIINYYNFDAVDVSKIVGEIDRLTHGQSIKSTIKPHLRTSKV